MYHLRVPQTEEELDAYYHFRWEMLRKPLHQPKGSERDAWDAMAHHQMVVDEEGNLGRRGAAVYQCRQRSFNPLYGRSSLRAGQRPWNADGYDAGIRCPSGRGQARHL